MTEYIIPQIIKYLNIDDLLQNNNRNRSLFDTGENLSINKVLQENFVCIVGEPGIGKSRLVAEIKNHFSGKALYHSTASLFNPKFVPHESEYCIIDALDEVEGNAFFSTLLSIKEYKSKNPDTKMLFTCRKHYVASYARHFASCTDLTYVELCRLKDEDVMGVVNRCSETTKANVTKSAKLKDILTIPRYLSFLLEYEEQRGDISNIGDLFEFIVSKSIRNTVNARYKDNDNESIKILIQRVLEKVAFIMEISRKDQITKDELYSILDEVRGNMTQMLVANFDLLFFESRILKDTNGTLQFENTELQEYLAAKELCRQDNVESVLYDVAVQRDLKHIYPNWYDVIPHISYSEDKINTFINVIKLIISYESSLENESFESLLRYIDPSILLLKQKEELFTILLEHYLRIPTYIGWKNQILKLTGDCYSSKCDIRLMPPVEHLNKIQLANICAILDVIVENSKLDKKVSDHWIAAAKHLFQTNNKDKQLAALNIYKALKDKEELICLSKYFNSFTKEVKEKFYNVTGYGKITNRGIVNCWLDGCYTSNPNALNAVLYIEDPSTLVYVYNEIIKANKLHEFFNPKGNLFVFYEPYLKKQFYIAWNGNLESKKILTRIVASFLDNHSSTNHSEIDAIIKPILLEKETGAVFIECFDNDWRLIKIISSFDSELVDTNLLSALEKLLRDAKKEVWYIDVILTTLINKVRNDEVKSTSISHYISRYAEIFDQWDKNTEEEAKRKMNEPFYIKAYNNLSDPNLSSFAKYDYAFELSKNIEFIKQQDSLPLLDVIETFFEEIDLNKMMLEKKDESSISLSMSLIKIPYFVKAMYYLGNHNLLKKHRLVLAKTLPIVCITTNFDASEIKNIYKCVIGSISKNEKVELIDWWKSRKDDFMNVSSDSIFVCITDFGIEALSYKLEEYINDYINQQDYSNKIAALKALELISKGYQNWDVENYRNLFNVLKEDNIESVKMMCNAILIEKYQDADAITWRTEYLKMHVIKSIHNNSGHLRPISIGEAEMTSQNPHMFRCFMNIKGNEKLDNQMLDLFDFGLSLCEKVETQEYSIYLLRQIYQFFINAGNDFYMSLLRKKVELFNAKNVSFLANNIMINAEMTYLIKGKISIDKAIKQYNKCIEKPHLEIRNDGDLRRFFTQIHSEVQKEIQDQGIYSLVRQENLSEDFIQRELKNTIINKCCQMGLETIRVDREVALQDDKRTDFLIWYGLCNPIMVELKLLNNPEIQREELRHEYKKKFVQYTNATNACLSVFWVFNVRKNGSNETKFKDLEYEYKDLNNTLVLLTDCKCSSVSETGLSKNKQASGIRGNGKRGKGKK